MLVERKTVRVLETSAMYTSTEREREREREGERETEREREREIEKVERLVTLIFFRQSFLSFPTSCQPLSRVSLPFCRSSDAAALLSYRN